MDWLVGIGTIILAIATFLYVYQSRRQTEVLIRQINMQIGQQIPRLFIKQVNFDSDSVHIEIQNSTNFPAQSVGLKTDFYIIEQRLFSDRDGNNIIGLGEATKLHDDGKTIYSKYYAAAPNRCKLRFENKEVYPNAAISFFSPQGVSRSFPASTTLSVNTKPIFLISWKGEQGLSSYQGFEYSRLRDFLLSNNVEAVAVVMSLICKDAGETIHYQGYVAQFALRTSLDHSLLESSKNKTRFDFLPLTQEEQLSANSWMISELYHNSYSNWHIF